MCVRARTSERGEYRGLQSDSDVLCVMETGVACMFAGTGSTADLNTGAFAKSHTQVNSLCPSVIGHSQSSGYSVSG